MFVIHLNCCFFKKFCDLQFKVLILMAMSKHIVQFKLRQILQATHNLTFNLSCHTILRMKEISPLISFSLPNRTMQNRITKRNSWLCLLWHQADVAPFIHCSRGRNVPMKSEEFSPLCLHISSKLFEYRGSVAFAVVWCQTFAFCLPSCRRFRSDNQDLQFNFTFLICLIAVDAKWRQLLNDLWRPETFACLLKNTEKFLDLVAQLCSWL